MKVGIEGQRILRTNKHGMDMVAIELIRNLQQIDHENQYVIFVKPDEDFSMLQETGNFSVQKIEGGSYPYWEQFLLPSAAEKAGCDILHCTSNTAPLSVKIPLIITLHDIIYMEHSYKEIIRGKGSNYQKFGNVYRKIVVPRVIKKSRRIITVSDYEKKTIGDFFRLGEDPRLLRVYNGVGTHFKPVSNTWELERIKDKYRLPENFFFFLGNTDPKKNTPGVLKAFSAFIKHSAKRYFLVMPDYNREDLEKLVDEIGDPELSNRIRLTGYVKNTDLPGIYSLCDAFLYPSLRESFGIPVLEAMACGAAVITSNTSSLPEIAGEAAMLVDPYNIEEITAAMARITGDANLREGYSQAGIRRAAGFSWNKMAEEVLGIYKKVYNEGRSHDN